MNLAPILFFCFRRPEHTRRVLESLSSNPESANSTLYAFIDGAKNDIDLSAIDDVEYVLNSRQWCGKVNIIRRSDNLGCAKSVIGAVTEYVNRFGSVIVLEDDNLLSPYFLSYINNALIRYEHNKRVMEVTGYRYPVQLKYPCSGFTSSSVGWGWATWKRAWDLFEPNGERLLYKISNDRSLSERFDYNGAYPFLNMLRDQVDGKIGGWDIRWSASILVNNGLTLFPSHSLVFNIGHDGTGVNCGKTKKFDTSIAQKPIVDLPSNVGIDRVFEDSLECYFVKTSGGVIKVAVKNVMRNIDRIVGRR